MVRIALVRLAFALATPVAVLVPSGLVHAQQRSGAIDTAIAQALYAASATRAASERRADERDTAQRRQITRLEADFEAAQVRAQSNAAETEAAQAEAERLAAELVQAQQNYVRELAAQDAAYARQIELFRSAVTDVASTPEGLEALRRFNEGDWPGARAILEDLNAAIDRGENIERAARYRSTAEIYYEAYQTGQESTGPVIEQYETVVNLDPDVASDWVRLMILYGTVERYDEMSIAIENAREAEGDPWIASVLASIPTEAIRARDENAAMESFRESVAQLRERHDEDRENVETLIGLIGTLYVLASMEVSTVGMESAASLIEELGPLIEANRTLLRSNDTINFTAIEADYLELAARLSLFRQDSGGAAMQVDRAIALRRELLTDDPDSIQRRQEIVDALEIRALVDVAQADYRSAVLRYREAAPMIAAYRVPGRATLGELIGLTERLTLMVGQAETLGMTGDAAMLGSEAVALARHVYALEPASDVTYFRLAEALLATGGAAVRANRELETEAMLEEARSFADELVAEYPMSVEARRVGWLVYASLAETAYANVTWNDVIARVEADQAAGFSGDGAGDLIAYARELLAGETE